MGERDAYLESEASYVVRVITADTYDNGFVAALESAGFIADTMYPNDVKTPFYDVKGITNEGGDRIAELFINDIPTEDELATLVEGSERVLSFYEV